MTSRELVKQTLEFKNTSGRVPRDLWSLPWANINYPEEMADICSSFEWDISGPQVIYKQTSAVTKGDPYEPGESIDAWGCKFVNLQKGVVGEVKEPLISPDDEEWKDTSKTNFPEEWLSFDIEQVNAECAKSDKFLMAGVCPRPFEQLQFIRGTENLYMDLVLKPKGMLEFIEKMHDFYCRVLEKWAHTDVDGLMMMDDWGAQNSLLINPETWIEIFKPMYKDYIDIAKKHGKKMFMHSDGYTLSIIPHLIEIGLDAFNTQIFCMTPEILKPFKGKITFWGEICRQQILSYGTIEDVDKAVKRVYDNLWNDGGCIAQCEFGAGAKPENVKQVYISWSKIKQSHI